MEACKQPIEYTVLRKINSVYDAKEWSMQFTGREDIEYSELSASDRKKLREELSEIGFDKFSDMIGLWDEVHDGWEIEGNVPMPSNISTAKSTGWVEQEIPIISIVHGHRYAETVNAYVKDDYALVDAEQYMERVS